MKKGAVGNCKEKCGRKSLPDNKISDIKEHFESNPKWSLKRASIELYISVSLVHKKNFKKTLKFKAYKPTLFSNIKARTSAGAQAQSSLWQFFVSKDGWQRNIIFSNEAV